MESGDVLKGREFLGEKLKALYVVVDDNREIKAIVLKFILAVFVMLHTVGVCGNGMIDDDSIRLERMELRNTIREEYEYP